MENIFVTGANRGIGLALTRRFLELGQRVFAGVRNPEGAAALADLPLELRERLTLVELDVTSAESVRRAAAEVAGHTPKLDVLVNMAGVSPAPHDARLEAVDLAKCREAFEINVIGPLCTAQA